MSNFKVRLFYDIDKKNYHLNPLSNRRGHFTKVTADEFLQLVSENKVTTR